MASTADKKAARAAEVQRVKNLERALRQERLGLVAITLAFVKESPDPARLLARLERMVEAAALQPRTPAKTARMLSDGLALIRRAMEQELGKPQGLFEPHVGHVRPAEAQSLAEPEGQAISLISPDRLTDDREATERSVRDTLVRALGQGPADDAELAARYLALGGTQMSRHALYAQRVELHRLGRICAVPSDGGPPRWGLAEHHQPAA